jgi:nudix-type nucleoside diphosphatase (YffH/AdpP family)
MTKDNSTIRINDTQTLAPGKGKLMSITFEQRRRDGSWQERNREVYDNGNSAVILPYDANRNTVLLTRQLRLPIYLQDGLDRSIEACAGKLDDETAEKRIIKEIEEELGYRIEKVDRLFELYASPAAIMEKLTFFTCAYSPADKVSGGGGLAEEGEDRGNRDHFRAGRRHGRRRRDHRCQNGRSHPIFWRTSSGSSSHPRLYLRSVP